MPSPPLLVRRRGEPPGPMPTCGGGAKALSGYLRLRRLRSLGAKVEAYYPAREIAGEAGLYLDEHWEDEAEAGIGSRGIRVGSLDRVVGRRRGVSRTARAM